MKKFLVVAVVLAFAMSAWAEDGKTTLKVKEETKGGVTEIKVKEKSPGVVEKAKIEEKGTTLNVTDKTKMKAGNVAKDTVKFEKYEANGDWVYVMKDDKLIRVKHSLSDNVKKDMLKLKKGDTINITSTYPLTAADLAVITNFEPAKVNPNPTPAK